MVKIGYPSPTYEGGSLTAPLLASRELESESSPLKTTTDGYGSTTGYTAGSAN